MQSGGLPHNAIKGEFRDSLTAGVFEAGFRRTVWRSRSTSETWATNGLTPRGRDEGFSS